MELKKYLSEHKLAVSILMDVLGYATYVIPGVGEFGDVLWAPISAFVFYQVYGERFGLLGTSLSFFEELLPFTDFVPSFTIAYFLSKRKAK